MVNKSPALKSSGEDTKYVSRSVLVFVDALKRSLDSSSNFLLIDCNIYMCTLIFILSNTISLFLSVTFTFLPKQML